MKKLIFTLLLMSVFQWTHAQAIYYFVGGTSPVSITLNSNWNTALDGSGSVRTANPGTDVLIIDGSNIGGLTPTTGTVTFTVSSTSCSQLKIINNANVVMQRVAGGGGTGTLTIQGDGAVSDDLLITAGSKLTISTPVADGSVVVSVGSASIPNVTGRIGGTVTVTGTATGNRLVSFTTGGLVVESTGILNSDLSSATSAYPFGSSSSQCAAFGITMQAGASLVHTGKYSPMGNTSAFQTIEFQTGSNYYSRITNPLSTGSYVAQKALSNFYVQNNSTFTADGSVYKFDKLIIESGSTYITHTSGSTPVLDTIRVDGTLISPAGSTNSLVIAGPVPRELPSGTGTVSVGAVIATEYTKVTLKKNITVNAATATTAIMDTFDFGNNQILGTGTTGFIARGLLTPNTSYTATTVSGSYNITIPTTPTPSGLNGLSVTGAGIQPNTVVLAFSSAGVVNLSKPATATASGVPVTFLNNSPATIITSNVNGLDSVSGSVTVPGNKSFNSAVNYIFNGPTTKPFNLSPYNSQTAGNVTFNAAVTSNRPLRVSGILKLGAGNFTVRPGDTLYLGSASSVTNASSSGYVVTDKDATTTGTVVRTNFTGPALFPVGTAARYMPVTLEPQVTAADFAVSVFEGITQDGTVSGTPYTAPQKAEVVDAVWTINRTVGSAAVDPCIVTINWDGALEGSNFTGFSDGQVGISHYNGIIWEDAAGTGDNTANTATATFSSFSPFGLARKLVVPVQFISVNASYNSGHVAVDWKMANDYLADHYVVERAGDDLQFASVGHLTSQHAPGDATYNFADLKPLSGNGFYRINAVDINGNVKRSAVVKISVNNTKDFMIIQNPVANKTLQMTMSGLEKGSYKISLLSSAGQIVFERSINYNGDPGSSLLSLPAGITKGLYRVVLSGISETRSVNVIIE